MKYIHQIILVLMVCAAWASEPVILTDALSDYVNSFIILDSGQILFVNADNELTLVSIDDPMQTEPLEIDLDPTYFGWVRPGYIGNLSSSPDGSFICFTQGASVPEELQTAEQYIPGPSLVIVCKTDGSYAEILGLTFEVGGGPQFDFMQDSRHIFGSPLLGCYPTPEDFADYWARDETYETLEGFIIDIRDGTRSGGSGGVLSDGYYKNPWSDLIAGGGFPTTEIYSVATGEVLLRLEDYSQGGIIDRWVLPDAGLAYTDGIQIIRYSDGSTVVNESDDITVFGRMSCGRYIFRCGGYGTPLLFGNIDWTDFSTPDSDTLPGIDDSIMPWGGTGVMDTPDGSGMIFAHGGCIYLYELP